MPTALAGAQPHSPAAQPAPGRNWRSRRAAIVTVAVVVALAATAVALGAGLPNAALHVRDVGAWLADSPLGAVTHAEGVSGEPDATVRLPGTKGDSLQIVQSGPVILVEDRRTGQISRIDPAQLTVTQTASYGTSGAQVLAGGPDAYVVLPSSGLVQRISTQTLSVVGAPVRLPSRIGSAAVTRQGRLWALLPGLGALDWVDGSRAGAPLPVSGRGDTVDLTLAGLSPVVTDATARTMTSIGSHGARRTVVLPALSAAPGSFGPLVAPATAGSEVPVVVPAAGRLLVVNTATGGLTATTLGTGAKATLGVPAVLGNRVYIPDESTGSLIVFDTTDGRLLAPVTVTGQPGSLQVFVSDGMLWANDPDGPDAVVVAPQGWVRHIGKYGTGLPGGPDSGQPQPTASTGGGNSAGPGPTQPPAPGPATSPPPAQPPGPPGTPSAVSGAGLITVTFTPSGGGTATGYALADVPAGATVTPATLPPSGQPFSFQVAGLSCASTYSFTVVARYASGSVDSQPTPLARPCVAPSAPTGLAAATANHAITVRWSAPAAAGGGTVSYDVSWNGAKSGSSNGLSGTSVTISGLVNTQAYTVSVTAVTAAGSSQAASGTVPLTPPQGSYNTFRNTTLTLNERSQPTQASASVATFPPLGSAPLGPRLTVLCQVTGSTVKDPGEAGLTGDIWDKVDYNGIAGYVSDLYVDTPESKAGNFDSYSDPPLWQCQ